MASVAKLYRTTICSTTMLVVWMIFLTSKHTSCFTSAEKSDLERVRRERRKRTEESHMHNRALTFTTMALDEEEADNDATARHENLFGFNVRTKVAEVRHSKFTMELDQENPKNQRVFTPAPSPNPSSAPSKSSVPSLSTAPTKSYKPTTSDAPTLSPVPSNAPSSKPSTSPSSDCTVPPTGIFGSSAINGTLVTYTYEMIVEQGVNDTDAQVQSTILPLVEKSITASLVPTLFEDTCGGNRRILTQQQYQYRRRLKLIGVGPLPNDEIMNVDCQVIEMPNSTTCVVVNGGFTIYSDEPNENLGNSEFAALRTISTTMNRGDYSSVHSSIVNMTYTTFSYTNITTAVSASTRNGLNTTGLVLIIVSSFVVGGSLLFLVWQRRQRLVEDGDQSYYDTQRVSPHGKRSSGGTNVQYKSGNSITTSSYGQY